MKPYKKYFDANKYLSITIPELLIENVVHPEKYVKLLQDVLIKLQKRFVGKKETAHFICWLLSKRFKKYGITFILIGEVRKGDKYKLGLTKSGYNGGDKNDIDIYCNENITKIQVDKKFYDLFSKHLLELFGHELIHRIQALNVEDIKLRGMIYQQPDPNINVKAYLANKYEIMSRAWQIVEECRFYGYDDNKIIDTIQRKKYAPISTSLMAYRGLFETNNKEDAVTLKLLYKYIYLYVVDNTGEN